MEEFPGIEALFGDTNNESSGNNVIFKKELILIVDDDELDLVAGGGEGRLPVPDTAVPKPLEGLYEEGATPFLRKTYAMVDDPDTDSFISWNESKLSFIIWDHHKFSTDILPKHFKHCNFSSFVRQLNTYGFKKLSPDRWEYANESFQKGKYYLLQNIKRKRHQSDNQVLRNQTRLSVNNLAESFHPEKLGKETELEKLKSDTYKLRMEILNIEKQQESANNYLLSFEERLSKTEHKQQQMLIFMARAIRNSLFNKILMQQLRPKQALNTAGISKKRKLIAPQCIKSPVEPTDNPGSQVQNDVATIGSEIQKAFSSDEARSSVIQGQKVNEVSSTKTSDVTSEDCLLWENLLDDDVVSETKAATEQANIQSKIVLELEELITKVSTNWDVSMKEMVEQAVRLQSQF